MSNVVLIRSFFTSNAPKTVSPAVYAVTTGSKPYCTHVYNPDKLTDRQIKHTMTCIYRSKEHCDEILKDLNVQSHPR